MICEKKYNSKVIYALKEQLIISETDLTMQSESNNFFSNYQIFLS